MKKELIGTTALVSAGLLMGSGVGQDALAQDGGWSVTVGGYLSSALEFRDEDDNGGQPGANLQSFGVFTDGELQITASTTLDNGISFKGRIEYEAFNQGGGTSVTTVATTGGGVGTGHAHANPSGTLVDEAWIEVSGVFGQIRLGREDDAAYSMQYQAPVGAYQMGPNTETFAVPAVGGNAVSSYPTTYISATGDAEKIVWFSPRISGFQLGVSYAPDDSRLEASSETGFFPGTPSLDNEAGASEDVFSIGLNFVESFNDIDIAVAGGYTKGDLEAQTTGGSADDIEQWSAGLNVGFAGFTVGGSIADSNGGMQNGADTLTWDAGITYNSGPFTVGFTYLSGTAGSAGPGEDELDMFAVTGTYNLGPGVDLWGGVKWYDYEDNAGAAGAENDGYIVAAGTSIGF